MTCIIEVDKPVFIAYGEFPQDRLRGYTLRELESKPDCDFIGIITKSGRAIPSNKEAVFGEYFLEDIRFHPNNHTTDTLEEYLPYQTGYLEQPLLN